MKQKPIKASNEPSAYGKKLSHWLRRIDVSATDTDHHLAEAAIREIGQAAIPILLEALRRGGRDAQRAARAFRVLGPEAASAVAEIQSNPGPVPTFAGSALAGIGRQAFEALASFVTHPDPMVRSAGAEGLSDLALKKQIAPDEARGVLPQLAQNTQHIHPQVRARSASALGAFATEPDLCVPALTLLLDDDDDLVRFSASQALGRFGKAASAALPKLIAGARSPSGPERVACVTAIGQLGLSEGYEAVLAALDDEDILVRAASVNGLGFFPEHSAEVVPVLVGALEGESRTLRWNALWALGRLGPLAKGALPAIRKWTDRPNEVGGEAILRRAIEQIEL
ncbi:MAG: HEAT repeat domain-containing protein [Verrucomicrobia subdivision 3 bacterium]|nr:HEAT repeat domain-containing protein [Limisphaerales bacterium]